MTRLSPFIGNVFQDALAGDDLQSLNPSDSRDVVATLGKGSAEAAVRAVAAAAEAFGSWKRLTGMGRAEALYRWAEVVAGRQEELAQAMAREVGKPITEARGEAARAVVILRYYAGEAVRELGEVIPSQLPDTLQFTLREPLGVVGLVTPWNFPVAIPLWKAAPALAFGNTVVLKPSDLAAGVANLLAETALQAGLPAGVFNVLQGKGTVVGEAMMAQEAVKALSFTGSGGVGARVAEVAARRNIRYQTEMGGKNAALVLKDADLDKAVALVSAGAMRYAGQKCTATSRVIVDKAVLPTFQDKLLAAVRALSLGPVTDAACAVGPVISEGSRSRILSVLANPGGEILAGGKAVPGEAFQYGSFLAPTVVGSLAPDSAVLKEELFGPVLALQEAEDLDHALSLANATPYGLSATVFTQDLRAVLTYVRRIEAGLVRVNGDTTGVDPHAPFGGVKGSSSGTREQGPAAREFYTETRTIQIA